MANFSFVDLAYTAGIIDGEGTIGITEIGTRDGSKNTRRRRSPQHRIYIAVAMTDAAIPLLLSEMFGGTIHTYEYNPGRHRPQTRWYLTGPRAVLCMEALIPYLRLKKAQAEIAVRFQKQFVTPNRGKKNVVEDQLAARRQVVQEVQALNARAAEVM